MKKNLVITNIFCQPLGASLYIEVPLYLILFIYFPKSGGPLAPQLLPLRGP